NELLEAAVAELRQVAAYFFGDELEEVDDVLGASFELLPQLRILGRDTDRARIEVTDPHHDAAHDHERRGREAELFRAKEGADDDVAAGLHLPVDLDHDPIAQTLDDQRLLGLREAKLPRCAGVLQ